MIRAALRRAWSADPAIHHFVGLTENAWDFNDPSTTGFGPQDCSEGVPAAVVDPIVGGMRKSAKALPEGIRRTGRFFADSSRKLHHAETSSVAAAAEGGATAQVISTPAATQPTAPKNAESEHELIRRHMHRSARWPARGSTKDYSQRL